MKRAERLQRMLNLIDERLESYTVEETVKRLNSYQGTGPTIREFYEGMHPLSAEVNEFESISQNEDLGSIIEIESFIGEPEAPILRIKTENLEESNRRNHESTEELYQPHELMKIFLSNKNFTPDTPLTLNLAEVLSTVNPHALNALQIATHLATQDNIGYYGLPPEHMDVQIMHGFSYPEHHLSIEESYWIEGDINDTLFSTDTQEDSESHEAA